MMSSFGSGQSDFLTPIPTSQETLNIGFDLATGTFASNYYSGYEIAFETVLGAAWSGSGTFSVITPIPAALPLFATGLGALGSLGWRRKRKAAA